MGEGGENAAVSCMRDHHADVRENVVVRDMLKYDGVVRHRKIAHVGSAGGQEDPVRPTIESLDGALDPRPLVPRGCAGKTDEHQRATVVRCEGRFPARGRCAVDDRSDELEGWRC